MITIDFETKSYADLPKVGAWAYSEDPTTDVICIAWGEGSEPIETWWPGKNRTDGIPLSLEVRIADGIKLEAHNVAFEKSIWINVLQKKYGWPELPEDIWEDTMAVAAYYALPQGLDRLARVLGIEGKDPEGSRLITKYSKLNLKTAKTEIPQEDFDKFVAYCVKDVQIEQSVSDFLGDLPDREKPVFQLDQKINMRGLYLDQDGIDAATAIADEVSADLTKQFREITNLNPGQNAKLIDWFEEQGLWLENLQKDPLTELLEEGDLPQGPCRKAIELRLAISKASTKKLDAMSRQRGEDGRARFQMTYHGAVTGRWTGRGFQPLNLNRGFEGVAPEQLVRDIMYRDPEYLGMLYGSAMDAVGKASRHWIQAEEGNRILAGDFVSIEAVILAVLAGETWKVDAFTNGEKIYELMGDKIHGLAPGTVTKKTHPAERQDGKTGELAFGYQGALGAWLKFDSSGRHSDERIVEICKAWRGEHPAIVAFWRGLEQAAVDATATPGREYNYRDIGFEMQDEWLSMVLPNGKRIWYWKPELRMTMPPWHKPREFEDCALNSCDCKARPQLTYMAQKEGQWKRVWTYGGKLAENCLTAETEVLTPEGWVRIINYKKGMKLWDGREWVYGGDLLDQGYKPVIDYAGVGITEDHLVLTTEGWQNAITSQSEGLDRAKVRAPGGYDTRGERGWEAKVEHDMRLRQNQSRRVFGAGHGANDFMRVPEIGEDISETHKARHDFPPSVLGLAEYARQVQATYASGLAQLRRPRDILLRTVELVREFLGRHGSYIQEGSVDRAAGQRRRLLPGELRVGGPDSTGQQQENKHPNTDTVGGDDCGPGKPEVGDKCDDAALPDKGGVAFRQSVYACVFDIANVGPLNRFTVRGRNGEVFIVHNCVQATSRELLVPAMFRAEDAGYPIILTVYDEIVSEAPINFGSKEEFVEVLAERPDFAKTWPIGVDAWVGNRYKK
jgi:DNA polymerase